MKMGAVSVAALFLATAAAGWFLRPTTGAKRAISPTVAPTMSAGLSAVAPKGREFLNQAQLNQALASRTLDRPVKSLLKVEKPMRFGDFEWSDSTVPAGPTWLRVDLGSQLISVFRGAHEIGTAVIVYGGDNKETPSGTFHILAKDRDHRSSIYDAAMPYTLQLTGDGVSIHGSTVRWGAATHGCIGVPLDFAHKLFDEARVGDEVVIIPPGARPT